MKAQVKVIRKYFTEKSTVGELYFNDRFVCFTLEDFDRLSLGFDKVYGETAIPAGTYKMIINMSSRFKKELPLLLNVPGFEGVRIHAGNTNKDTHGCILVGMTRDKDFVGNSNIAMGILMEKLLKYSEYEITIIKDQDNS